MVGDSTTVLLYKAMRAAVAARPGRTEIVIDRDNFPTDRYVADGVAARVRPDAALDRASTPPPASPPSCWPRSSGRQTALVVAQPRGLPLGLPGRRARADRGSPTTPARWCSGTCATRSGSVPLDLDAWGVDLAVGCTYKYLNGGPGAPAFVYVAARHLDAADPADPGLDGRGRPVPDGPDATHPAAGIRRFLSGTPPILGMLALQDMLALVDEVGIDAVRAKSVGADVVRDRRSPTSCSRRRRRASPRRATRRVRGGHVTLNHPLMREVTAALWQRDVIPDYRDPHGLRLGLSPLSTSYAEVERGLALVLAVLDASTASPSAADRAFDDA